MHVKAESDSRKLKMAPAGLSPALFIKVFGAGTADPFFKEGPTGEQCTFLYSSNRCDTENWPVIFDHSAFWVMNLASQLELKSGCFLNEAETILLIG